MKNIIRILISFMLLPVTAQDGLKMPVANTIEILEDDSNEDIISKTAHVVPNSVQLEALKDGYIAFVHFGPNTFTKKEWGTGMEDPKVFNLKNLDTDQWCRAMKKAGMKKVIFTAKHHDGFVLWQSRYTNHGIMSSPFKDGKGDIMKELSESCRKYGLKLGVYLSPADLYQIENSDGLYGNLSEYTHRTIPRTIEGRPFKNKTTFNFKVDDYNEYFLNQLFELLTEYGPIHEVWFDGAHPKRKGGQTYHYSAWKELIHSLAPEAVIFGKEDIRWAGNESGNTRATEWNVIPYEGDPNTMSIFGDITGDSIGMRSQLYNAKYLHYQPAEINTSIREGWFYRDEETQQTRSADDVFDIYERAVGGNAIFLLNIPPNREGLFPAEDVAVLEEVGKRIEETYGNDLFKNAKADKALLDDQLKTFMLLKDDRTAVIIDTEKPVTINRLLVQEAVATHGERVEEHALDAWLDDSWQEVAKSTNIGFKRVLRFTEVTSDKFRLRILSSRLDPTIAKIAAHYYKKRPPQLEITRNATGMVRIEAKKDEFTWKRDKKTLPSEEKIIITYSLDDESVKVYKEPFMLTKGTVKAVASKDNIEGSNTIATFGLLKNTWKIDADSFSGGNRAEFTIDANPHSFWVSEAKASPHYLEIDLGEEQTISAFSYTPKASEKNSMIEKGLIKISKNGKKWKQVESFEFGNLINDPTTRRHNFQQKINTRFIRLEVLRIAGDGERASAAEIDLYSE